jgi:hypothetical protein
MGEENVTWWDRHGWIANEWARRISIFGAVVALLAIAHTFWP